MPSWLADVPIESDTVLIWTYVVADIFLLALLIPRYGIRHRIGRRPMPEPQTRLAAVAHRLAGRPAWTALAAGLGALAGWLLIYIIVDVQDVFGAPASDVIRAGATGAGAGIGIAVANLVRTAWWRKIVAIVTIPLVVAAGGVMINRDVAYYPRLGDVFGDTGVHTLPLEPGGSKGHSLKNYDPPADMPKTGTVGTVTIPGTLSGWKGRPAWVYLPPAARVKNPPKLPVIIGLSGEPGGPSDLFLAGGMEARLNAIAAAHHGVAPILVVPDQLGSYRGNPMCVNSKLGNVARYITADVRDWILQHLPVSTNRRYWTVAGFSEGGTCAVQFVTEYPAIFGSAIPVSPELGPLNGSVAHTIKVGFRGSVKDYEAAMPINVMRRTKHYPATRIVYSVGADDTRYGKDAGLLAAESRKVGMIVSYKRLPGLAHNWNTGAAGLQYGLDELTSWWNLP